MVNKRESAAKAERAFKLFDKDNDGYITKVEFQKISEKLDKSQVHKGKCCNIRTFSTFYVFAKALLKIFIYKCIMQHIPIYPIKSRSMQSIRSLIKTMMVFLALLNSRKWWTVKIPNNTYLIYIWFYLHLFLLSNKWDLCGENCSLRVWCESIFVSQQEKAGQCQLQTIK